MQRIGSMKIFLITIYFVPVFFLFLDTSLAADGDTKSCSSIFMGAEIGHHSLQPVGELTFAELTAIVQAIKPTWDTKAHRRFQLPAKQFDERADGWQAPELAYTGDRPYEYDDFPNLSDDIFVGINTALKSRLQKGATAERLGFRGFEGKVVGDIGTRDGRYVRTLKDLGAKEVYGIEPNKEELEKAVQTGVLDFEHAIPFTLQDIPDNLRRKMDVVVVFNFIMILAEYDRFFKTVYHVLPEEGQMVITFTEDYTLKKTEPVLRKYFEINRARLWRINGNSPHKYLVICTKRPKSLVD